MVDSMKMSEEIFSIQDEGIFLERKEISWKHLDSAGLLFLVVEFSRRMTKYRNFLLSFFLLSLANTKTDEETKTC